MIESIEKELGGYKLPGSYIALMKMHNGGRLKKRCFSSNLEEGYGESDQVWVDSIMGIGNGKNIPLLESNFFKDIIEENCGKNWIRGIFFAGTPTGGHDMIMLDYKECGKRGEPCVAHVEIGGDFDVSFLAKDFETFIRGLSFDSEFES